MARELRWRIRAAAGVDSGDELEDETGAAVKEEAADGGMEVESRSEEHTSEPSHNQRSRMPSSA